MKAILAILTVWLCLFSHAYADSGVDKKLAAALAEVFPEAEVSGVRESVIPGLYEVMVGAEVFYVSADGSYLLRGDIYDLKKRANLTEDQRAIARANILREIPASDYIEFAAEEPGDTIYVFTDVSCGFCRKLHKDVPELNSKGITVRYLAFPRNGIDTPIYDTMVSVWCAKDRNEALTLAKQGESIKPASCENPVRQEFELGRAMGIRGTPAIFLENGQALPGYVPPFELVRLARQQ